MAHPPTVVSVPKVAHRLKGGPIHVWSVKSFSQCFGKDFLHRKGERQRKKGRDGGGRRKELEKEGNKGGREKEDKKRKRPNSPHHC